MPESDPFGRFLEPALLILISLADAPKHGYAMSEDIVRFAAVQLGPGTLYGALTRLERLGWIVALEADDRRKPYALTEQGRQVLQAHVAQLQQVAATGSARLGTT